MSRYSLILLALASSTLLFAETVSDGQKNQKAAAVSAALLQKLSGELKGQIQSGGPLAALHFCSNNAIILTDQIAKESNTSLKRVSLKNRNPINAVTPEEQAVLEKWEKTLRSQEPLPAYEAKRHANGEYTYYKPILINNETCLKCHGEITADSPLYQAIKTAYPEDKATGYRMGDLRGMVVVTLPKED